MQRRAVHAAAPPDRGGGAAPARGKGRQGVRRPVGDDAKWKCSQPASAWMEVSDVAGVVAFDGGSVEVHEAAPSQRDSFGGFGGGEDVARTAMNTAASCASCVDTTGVA